MNSHLKICPVTVGDIKSDRQTGCNPIPVVPLREPQGTKNKTLEDQNKEKCKVQTCSLSLSN